MQRSRRSIINILAAVTNNRINVIVPFVIRTIIIYKLGEKYTGLGGLFTSLLTFLSVSELGFSSAVTYLMYKPMARKTKEDVGHINSLLNYIRRVYLVVG